MPACPSLPFHGFVESLEDYTSGTTELSTTTVTPKFVPILRRLYGRYDFPLCFSGKKKEHKLKLLGPDIFQWGGGLPCEGVGVKKIGMSLERKEKFVFNF